MGLQQVKSDVLKEAQEKADEIVEEAEEEADQIVEEAELEAEKIKEETEEEIEAEKESIRRKQLSNARMKARERKLEAKQRNLDKAFDRFRTELEDLDETEREEFVENCVGKSEFDIGRVKASPGFVDAVEKAGFDAEESSKEGIILVSEDGERRISFTFDKIVEDFRDRYRQEVSEALFE